MSRPDSTPAPPQILYLDDWLAIVAKPSGELVHPGWARGEPTTMTRLRDFLGQRVYPVHRLDRGTSGAVVLARTPAAARAITDRWTRGEVNKCYLALVRGEAPDEGLIDHPVRKHEKGPERVPAITRFRCIARCTVARCSLVRAEPRTGRLHQLRRHFKHISHPIVGDVNYGDGRFNRSFRSQWQLHRLALHAASVAFRHPETDESLSVRAPIPSDLAEPLAALELDQKLLP